MLTLADNPAYDDQGLPQDRSPYRGTKLVPVDGDAPETASSEPSAGEADSAGTEEDADGAGAESPGASEENDPAADDVAGQGGSAGDEDVASDEVTDVDVDVDVEADVDVEVATRPAAFTVPGAPSEPLDEMPLPRRARLLGNWLDGVDKLTPRARDHFTYQHAWVVTGAKFGWWRGAEALEILVGVDQELQARFGVGAQYEAEARAALEEVLRKSDGR
jgi:hypothetical protein